MFNILENLFFFYLKNKSSQLIRENMAFSEVLDPVTAFCDFILVTMVKHTFCDLYLSVTVTQEYVAPNNHTNPQPG
jgi:hypothetical protein